jgi:hypothetical protein
LIEAGDGDGAAAAASEHVRTAAEVGMRQLAGLDAGQRAAKKDAKDR